MCNWIGIATTCALATLLSSAPAASQEVWENDWDVDGDGELTLEEFHEGFMARLNLADWDADADGRLSEDEFAGGIYDRYDFDATGAIDEAEYGALEQDFGAEGLWAEEEDAISGDIEIGEAEEGEGLIEAEVPTSGGVREGRDALRPWDIDGDGIIVRDEFLDGFSDWGTFGDFDVDVDGLITGAELSEGIFKLYDDDFDGLIEEPELTKMGDDMGDGGLFDI